MYLSGGKSDPDLNAYREAHLEMFYQKAYRKAFRYKIQKECPPLWSKIARNMAIPNLYIIEQVVNPDEKSFCSVNLPKHYIYTKKHETYRNILRKAGYIDEPVDRFKDELDFQGNGYGFHMGEPQSEREILEYFYDFWPYAAAWSQSNFVQAIFDSNRRGNSKMIGIVQTRPMQLIGCEHIHISSKQIPFFIEGILIVTNLDEMMRILELYRDPNSLYDTGCCGNPYIVGLHCLLAPLVREENIIPVLKEMKSVEDLFSMIPEETFKPKEKEGLNNRKNDTRDILWYYASSTEKESLNGKLKLHKDRIEQIDTAAQLGMRSAWYNLRLSMDVDSRLELAEQYQLFLQEEDRLLEESNRIHGTNILRLGIAFEMYATDDIFEDNDFEGALDFDNLLDEDYGVDDDQGMLPAETAVKDFTREDSQWIAEQRDSTLAARMTWDPGTGSHM
jgi:hypothetical protein